MSSYTVRVPEDGSIVDVSGLYLVEDRVTVLFGPNGAGKTTVLRALAGVGDRNPMLPCHYLPQNPYLFRGSAGWNLGLGLDTEQVAWAGQLAQRLGVDDLLNQPAHNLSGGERHRLALARALAQRDPWILLDEPLASVDHADRQRVLEVIASVLEGRSAVIVTHDLDTAVALADDIAVLDGGRLLQQGGLGEVLSSPSSVEAARILGVRNVISGVATPGEGITSVKGEAVTVVGKGVVEGTARAMFPAESVTLATGAAPGGSPRNSWEGSVVEIKRLASLIEVVVDIGVDVVALLTPAALDDLALAPGVSVRVTVKATSVVVVPA